jgi:integrase
LKNLLRLLSVCARKSRSDHAGCTQVVPKTWRLIVELTDAVVAKLTLKGMPERLVADDAMPGLRLRLRKGAKGIVSRKWIYKYKDPAGVQRTFTRDCAGVSIAQARRWAGTLQAGRRLGKEPAQERDAGHLKSEQTFGAALRTYLPTKATKRPKTRKEIERHLLVYCRPLHRIPLASISPAVLSSRLTTIAAASGSATAETVRRSVHAYLGWAMQQELVTRNAAMGVERRRIKARDRVLDADELRAVWQATDDGSDHSTIVRILMFTGLRANEVGGLRWSEVRSDRIELPAERTKNHRPHTVPLTPQVSALLASRARAGEFVFGKVQRAGFGAWSRGKRALDANSGVMDWVIHDLRRTISTGMHELGIAPHVVEAALGHVSGFRAGVAGTYNRASYEGAVRVALATWETHITEIVSGKISGDRVVPLIRA